MKFLNYTIAIIALLIIIYGCNKSIASTYSLEKLDRNRFKILDKQILSLDQVAGVYNGEICESNNHKYKKVKLTLLKNSTFDFVSESINSNRKTEKIQGYYSYNADTLKLYANSHDKKFVFKKNTLLFVGYDTENACEITKDSNVLHKIQSLE